MISSCKYWHTTIKYDRIYREVVIKMYLEEEDLYFTLNSKREELKLFNGAKCKIVNSRRDDNLLEVYVYGFNSFILVGADELDE